MRYSMKELAKPGMGALHRYEPGKPLEETARELGLEDSSEIIKLASNENAWGPSPKAVEAMERCIGKMHLYPDGGGFYLRRALAEQWGVSMDQLVLGDGSNELIVLISHLFLRPGDAIVMADRAFVVYRLVASAFGAFTTAVPMVQHTHDLGAMAEAITDTTRIVYISNPNNPTGTAVSQAAVDRFMEALPDHVVVVFDEAYAELLPEAYTLDVVQYLHQKRNVFILRTFSKAYGLAGLRIGYAVTTEEGADLLNRVRQPFNVNAMAQEAALAALADGEHLDRTRLGIEAGRQYLEQAFNELGLQYVASLANFMLVETGGGRDIFQRLLRRKVIVRPMDGYHMPDHIRVTIGTEDENKAFIAALREALKEQEQL